MWIFSKALAFLLAGLALGVWLSKRIYRWAARLAVGGMLLTISLVLCFAFSYLAHLFGLAAIVGAFAAGLILEPEHSRIFQEYEKEKEPLEHLLHPLSTIFVPLFFLHMGMLVDLGALFSLPTLEIGLVLSIAAVAGKMACAGGIVRHRKSMDRWTVAIGMIPRGRWD